MTTTKKRKREEREERRRREEKLARANRRYRRRALAAARARRLRKRAVLEAGALGIRSARADVPNDYQLSALGWLSLEALRRRDPDLDREEWIALLPAGVQKKIRIRDWILESTIHPPRYPWREVNVHMPESGEELRRRAGRWVDTPPPWKEGDKR